MGAEATMPWTMRSSAARPDSVGSANLSRASAKATRVCRNASARRASITDSATPTATAHVVALTKTVASSSVLTTTRTWIDWRHRRARRRIERRQSETTATAAGVNNTLYKLWAFALSAAITGMAGALLVAGAGVTVTQFPVEQSILLLAVVLLGGVYNLWGALVAAFFLRFLPKLLDDKLGLPPEALTMLFGLGVMQVLLVQPKGVVEDLRKLGLLIGRKVGLVGRTPKVPATQGSPA